MLWFHFTFVLNFESVNFIFLNGVIIQNDLFNMAKGSVTALTLLNLSAAFETLDHTIHLDCTHFMESMNWHLAGSNHTC